MTGLLIRPGDGAGQRPFHAGGDDDGVAGLEAIPDRKEPVDARDARHR